MNYKKKIFYLTSLFLVGVVFTQNNRMVNHITFSGNKSIRTGILKKELQLKPKRFLKSTPFRDRALKLDVISIKNKYLTSGFLDVSVNPKITIIDNKLVDIEYRITEGEGFRLGEVNIEGNDSVEMSEIIEMLKMKVGEPYNPFLMSRLLSDVEYLYYKKGKLLAEVNASISRENENIISDITIHEGKTFHITHIAITGITNYHDKFVLRELTFKNGDIYNINEIEKSQSRIFSSGLFSSVEIRPVIDSNSENGVTLEIKVREYSSKQVKTDIGLGQEPSSLGEGAPPASIFELDVKWQPGTILNTASRIEFGSNLAVRLDKNITLPNINYEITWFTPWILGIRLPLRMKYYHNEQIDEKLDGIASSFIYRTGERYKLSGSINLEFIKSLVESDQKRSIQVSYIEQKLNNFIYPSLGYFYSVNTELNGTILGGEVHFLKLDFEYKKFYELDKNITLGVHHRFGYLKSIHFRQQNVSSIPSFYKFKLGGSTSLRGWRNTDDINPEGGTIRFQSNIEFRYPLFWIIGGELFLDTGKLTDQFNSDLFTNWLWDIGTGITISSPIGPLRMDIAIPQGNWSKPTVLLSILYLF